MLIPSEAHIAYNKFKDMGGEKGWSLTLALLLKVLISSFPRPDQHNQLSVQVPALPYMYREDANEGK